MLQLHHRSLTLCTCLLLKSPRDDNRTLCQGIISKVMDRGQRGIYGPWLDSLPYPSQEGDPYPLWLEWWLEGSLGDDLRCHIMESSDLVFSSPFSTIDVH